MKYIKKYLKKEYLPFVILVMLLMPLHIATKLEFSDDLLYASLYENIRNGSQTIADIAKDFYETWSSRIIIEPLAILVVSYPIVWATMDIGAFLLIAVSIAYLVPAQKTMFRNILICSMILLYPFGHLGAAGWVACTVGYLWTVACVIYVLTAVRKEYTGHKIHWYEYITYIIAVIFAANNEQANLCLLGFLTCFTLYAIIKKKKSGFLLVLLVSTAIEFVVIMTAPGNNLRLANGIAVIMPEFSSYNIVQKVYMAYSYTMNSFIVDFNIIFIIFSMLLFGITYYKGKKTIDKWVALVPIAYAMLACIQPWKQLTLFWGPQFKLTEITSRRDYLPTIMSFIVLVCIVRTLYVIYERNKEFVISILVLGVGLCSRLAMGFSPTVYQSHYRTAIYVYFAFVFATVYLAENKQQYLKHKKQMLIIIVLFAAITLFDLILTINMSGGIIAK